MLTGMNPQRAQTAVDELIAIAHAVKSGTLEKDTKAFVEAAKKAEKAKGDLAAERSSLEKREKAAAKKEGTNKRAAEKIKAEREALKDDQLRWNRQKAKEMEEIQTSRTQVDTSAAAVRKRDQSAQDLMAQARTMMDAARELDKSAKALKSDYQERLNRIEAAAKGA